MKASKWPTVTLSDLITTKSGGTPSRENPSFWNGDVPWFSGKDLKSLYLNDSIEHVSAMAIGQGTKLCEPNTILVLVRGMTLMKEVPIGILSRRSAFNQDVKALVPKDSSFDVRFVAYFLLAENARVRNLVTTAGHGTGRLPLDALEEYPILKPPLAEQRKIADILSTWDEALEKFSALITARELRKKAFMQRLFIHHIRPGRAPLNWVTAKLGSLFTERVEQNRTDLPLLSITADRGVVLRSDVSKRDTSSEDKSKYLRIAAGDIGYNTMRMWQGVSALSSLEGIISPAYTVCTPTSLVDGRFAAHFFKFGPTIQLFYRYSQGLVDDTLNLKFHHFAAIEVTVPSDLKEQQQIAAILDTADEELILLRAQRSAVIQQRRGLMQQLLTGRLRVDTTGKNNV